MTKTVKILLALFAVLALGAGGAALAQSSGNGQDGQNPTANGKALRDRPKPIRGDLTVMGQDGQTKQVHLERGKVSEVSDTGFTLTGPDGVVNHIVVNDQTKIFPQGTELADLDGKGVTVIAEAKDGDNWVATFVGSRRHDRGNGPRPGQGRQGQGQGPSTGDPAPDQSNPEQPNPEQPSPDQSEIAPSDMEF